MAMNLQLVKFSRQEIERIREEFSNYEFNINDDGVISLRYSDAYDIEDIIIYKQINEYGVAFYTAEIEIANRDEEIMTPEVLGQHGYEITREDMVEYIGKEKAKKLREIAEKEWEKIKDQYVGSFEDFYEEILAEEFNIWLENNFEAEAGEWESKPTLKARQMDIEVEIGTKIIEEQCYVNIPHYHYYKGYYMRITTQSLEHLLMVLYLRDLLINTYNKYIGL